MNELVLTITDKTDKLLLLSQLSAEPIDTHPPFIIINIKYYTIYYMIQCTNIYIERDRKSFFLLLFTSLNIHFDF